MFIYVIYPWYFTQRGRLLIDDILRIIRKMDVLFDFFHSFENMKIKSVFKVSSAHRVSWAKLSYSTFQK